MPAPVSYPTAREVAVAIVTAARACDENPIETIGGKRCNQARWYAFAAMTGAFPDFGYAKIARWCGWHGKRAENAKYVLDHDARPAEWWRDDTLHQVKIALYAEIARTDGVVANSLMAVASALTPRPDMTIKRAPGPPVANPVLIPNGRRYIPIAERVAKVVSAEADAKAARALVPVSTEGVALSYRPDAPAHKRNVDIHTAELMGDPDPQRSALWARQHGWRDETKTEETADDI